MPELPDVENFRRYLNATALYKTITDVAVGSTKILRGISGRDLGSALRGRRMERTRLDFENGYHLAYDSLRMLGAVGIVRDPDAFIAQKDLGPDAMAPSLDERGFVERMAGRRGQVKSALMDQHFLAGIGNIYSDEILFQAGLHPECPVRDLDRIQLGTLYRSMRSALGVAIERGAGSEQLVERLPSTYLLPRREEGAECPRCGGKIKTLKASGRTAYYCLRCQPAAAKD